ncbi:hypothetical protein [Rhizobium sp. C1]|uniref:hypothetical protein n=1 Tax=Rhizobium sp. C1 TaxID=1349799 RepID=UPI001E2D0B39|nr:hypothetical protein [Rhizobium sp. C1]MCD2180405.1 hypothetical protein [Rhizobium sp. C1]
MLSEPRLGNHIVVAWASVVPPADICLAEKEAGRAPVITFVDIIGPCADEQIVEAVAVCCRQA